MGREEFNAIRHPERVPEEVDELPPSDSDRGESVIIGSWQSREERERNIRRLQDRNVTSRDPADESFLRRLYGSFLD